MSLNSFREGECVLTTHKNCPCIEFVLAEHERHGFQVGQLLHYRLELNDAKGEPNAPPHKLTLAFATADVAITGCRLERLANYLRDGELLGVRMLPDRYANLDTSKTFVAQITVQLMSKD
jgi:hypothetical protein